MILASSNPGDLVLDFFAGSGTTGVAAHESGRRFILVDDNPQAFEVMRKRLEGNERPVRQRTPRRNIRCFINCSTWNNQTVPDIHAAFMPPRCRRNDAVTGRNDVASAPACR